MNPIAPCGINCTTCYAYQRKKNVCQGCRAAEGSKLHHCTVCKIANCELLAETSSGFCYDCSRFPCARLKLLDKRYRLRYHTSLADDLRKLQSEGLEHYLEQEEHRWTCPHCNGKLCIHNENCPQCEKKVVRKKR